MQQGDKRPARSRAKVVAPLVTVVSGVQDELKQIAKQDPALAKSALAGSALVLAAELDSPETAAAAKANCARVLLDTLNRLRELAPPPAAEDRLDDLAGRRAKRLERRSAS